MSTPETLTYSSSQFVNVDTTHYNISGGSTKQPRCLRALEDVYAKTTMIELADELLLMGIDEPVYFDQAVKMRSGK